MRALPLKGVAISTIPLPQRFFVAMFLRMTDRGAEIATSLTLLAMTEKATISIMHWTSKIRQLQVGK